MIAIIGDMHGEFNRLNALTKKYLEAGDTLIVAGDMGLCWAKDKCFDYWCKFFEDRPFQTLWIDGNHENFDMIEEYPIEVWNGGKVHKIVGDKVIHLMRGQVYTIENMKFFTFGGGRSHDIEGGIFDRSDENFKEKTKMARRKGLPYRILGESWWKQEMPSEEEYAEGLGNLEANDWAVDFVITHSAPANTLAYMDLSFTPDKLTSYLEDIDSKLSFRKWYFGHYHLDLVIDNKHTAIYKAMAEIRKLPA